MRHKGHNTLNTVYNGQGGFSRTSAPVNQARLAGGTATGASSSSFTS